MKIIDQRVPLCLALAVLFGFDAFGLSTRRLDGSESRSETIEFTDVRSQTLEFIAYHRSITLTAEQDGVMREALSGIPAPCCADRTARTCCCPCNMAKSWWGLSKHLIHDRGFDAEQVRASVEEWLRFINPGGFSGNACYTGGCGRPFHRNGCGGMNEERVAF